MTHLYDMLAERTADWRKADYPCETYPLITDLLRYQAESDPEKLRFLRRPQLRALEAYWYLRLVEDTPHVLALYKKNYSRKGDLVKALGVPGVAFEKVDFELEDLFERIRTDNDYVRRYKLESLRETLTLAYPSYILALAMGAGKTILIGAIIATEFAMAIEYPDGPFVANALVFAPGKTIIESLRELSAMPYEKILPPRLYKPFAASVKLTFTRDGEKDIPVIRRSCFNVVVTNTEKIRVQKESIRKSDLGQMVMAYVEEEKAREEVANLRLQTLASLPHLAVFSDEAHHTYGQSLLGTWVRDAQTGERAFKEAGIKKVRRTVDYLAAKTNLICVVNTTGTPYFERQPLKDVVVWYGLSEGIRDGILKEIAGSIYAYSFSAANTDQFITEVITDFFQNYGQVQLPSGASAKLAVYFPQTDDLKELRPVIDQALVSCGQSPSLVLVNTSDPTLTKTADIDAFNRLNDPLSPHRVILLVNKGTEGWNCPSLFSCALARKLKSSNNFVLQAATRCLRQVPGNNTKARIYLSMDNRAILDRQLQETYGESISDMGRAYRDARSAVLKLRKIDLPPLVITRILRSVIRRDEPENRIKLRKPELAAVESLTRAVYKVAIQATTQSVLQQVGDTLVVDSSPDTMDLYTAAADLAATYRMDIWNIHDELTRLYGSEGEVPNAHLTALASQIEQQTRHYETREEKVEVALALVKPQGFRQETAPDGTEVYTAEITYFKEREHLLMRVEELQDNPGDFGFHYTPYNFDSNPEKSFFEQIVAHLNLHPKEIEDIYFTGALTNPEQTDFFVEYKDETGQWRRYSPDFIIRKKPHGDKPGKCLIVEVKAERERNHPIDGESGLKAMAVRRWETLNPDRLQYEMIFTDGDVVGPNQNRIARRFVEEAQP